MNRREVIFSAWQPATIKPGRDWGPYVYFTCFSCPHLPYSTEVPKKARPYGCLLAVLVKV